MKLYPWLGCLYLEYFTEAFFFTIFSRCQGLEQRSSQRFVDFAYNNRTHSTISAQFEIECLHWLRHYLFWRAGGWVVLLCMGPVQAQYFCLMVLFHQIYFASALISICLHLVMYCCSSRLLTFDLGQEHPSIFTASLCCSQFHLKRLEVQFTSYTRYALERNGFYLLKVAHQHFDSLSNVLQDCNQALLSLQ